MFRGELRRKYGLTLEQWDAMLIAQSGRCYICPEAFDDSRRGPRAVCVDHDHVTGKVRDLLCRECNLGLGRLRDCPELLARATEYLDRRGLAVTTVDAARMAADVQAALDNNR